ncbi:MAG: TIGR03960 family B12-binding radical SAM protein [Lachnospiraceae bacterium]|nr:TIGR03960 family B12-binding radical SAM protein [Lachnospiraceae bacterium]
MKKERKLALSFRQLLTIDKPERYLGNEINAIYKDADKVRLRFALCFPDVYEIGMSHLGIQILYDMFNKRDDVWCERVYSPWVDMDELMRKAEVPLFALESQDEIRDFDFLGITLQYEMCYTNVLQILDLSRIPIYADQRSEKDPIVIGGGPCAYNPEPIADFFDLFYIGEGEAVYDELFNEYLRVKESGGSRRDFLIAAANIEGIYAPSLYEAKYGLDGRISSFSSKIEGVPIKVKKVIATDLDKAPYPEKPLVPYIQVTQDRAVLEVMRGCIRGCRFCQAGQIYKPVRQRSLDFLKCAATNILDSTGQDEITLSSLSTSDFSNTGELVHWLIDNYREKYVNISLPSLRIDSFSLDIMSRVQDVKKSSLTFACEAGSQRLRDVINKGITEEDIMRGSAEAFKGGWSKVKLYFMLGLPFERDEDVLEIAGLADRIASNYYDTVPKEERKGIRVMINSSASFFVPKPFTPFQWAAMDSAENFSRKAHLVKDAMKSKLNHKSLTFKYHESSVSVLEGVLARGDRRLSEVILKAYKKGCIYDAWSDLFKGDRWDEAFKESGIDPAFYTERERDWDEILPWDFIDIGVSREYLYSEWKKAERGEITENCADKCSGCGAAAFGCGICVKERTISK